jgi:hypothetical protein
MKLERITFKDLSGGLQTKTTPDMSLFNQIPHCINGVFSRVVGGIIGRKGSEKQSQVVDDEVVEKLFIYYNGTTKYYLSVINDGETSEQKDIYKSASYFSGAWSKVKEDLGLIANVNFENFATKLAIFDGVNAPKWWNGSAISDITNAPTTGMYPAQYQQRLFVLDNESFLHYSDVINSTGDGLVSDTWTNRGIHPNDGQDPKGLVRHRGLLRIFKTESIYNYDGTNEPEPIINIGTHSSKSIVTTDLAVFFHHPSGIWMMTSGAPILISSRVQKFLDGMSSANWENVSAGKDLNENVYFWIGDVTISDQFQFDYGTTYSDVVLVYNTKSQEWAVFTGWNARTWFYDQFTGKTYFGDEDGQIWEINKGYSEVNGSSKTAISFDVILNPMDFGYPERYKEVETIIIDGVHSLNMSVGDGYEKLEEVEQKDENTFGIMREKKVVKELWIRISQAYNDTPPYIRKVILDDINIMEDER